jgi:hypothetical protein
LQRAGTNRIGVGFDPAAPRRKRRKLCHNGGAEPVLAAKIDNIDDLLSLILRNLLKTLEGAKIPAYRLIRD